MELDARLEGWLYIAYGLESGFSPISLNWHRRFCVLEPNLQKFYVLKDEQSASSVSNTAVVRLDDDYKEESDTTEEVFQKPLDEVFDAGTRLTQIQQYRISKRIKSSGVRLSTRIPSSSSLITDAKCGKAVSVLGINRTKSFIMDRNVTEKAVALLGIDRSLSWSILDTPVTEKAVAILGMNRTQSVNNGFEKASVDPMEATVPNNPMVWTVYLGSDCPPSIRVVHPSLSGREHTFCVETSKRSVYLACRSDLELNRWIDSLSHVVDPLKEERVQQDQSLTVWVIEAKHLPKKRYFVEVFLDNTFCCRTVTKIVTEMLFWGENFHFWDIKCFRKIRVVLRRENKNKKACVVGETEVDVADLALGQELESWYTLVTPHKPTAHTQEPQIRVKFKLQIMTVLPLNTYEPFLTYLTNNSLQLCTVLEAHLTVRYKEELANLLLYILQDFNKAQDFLEEIVMQEVDHTEDPSLLFRGNSIATKAVDIYMKLIGSSYLKNTLKLFIKDIYSNAQEYEVDIKRMAPGEDFTTNQQNMRMKVDKAWALILSSYPKFPSDLRDLFARVRERCEKAGRAEISKKLITGSIFLRFFCPAIMSPSLFNLTNEYPDEKVGRCLILTAKVIQNLANFTKFGGKEEYMSFMNEFVESAIPNMDLFLTKISEPLESDYKATELYNSNIGHTLASLHCFLTEKISFFTEEQKQELGNLSQILADLDIACDTAKKENPFSPIESLSGSSTPTRRRKTGSLPAIMVNENQRQNLKTRSLETMGHSLDKCTESYGYVTFHPFTTASPESAGDKTPTNELNVDPQTEPSRRRSLPAVPEETSTLSYNGRQMSDPTSNLKRYRGETIDEEVTVQQLTHAIEKLGALRRAIGSFLYTQTGHNPTSDEEVISMLETLTTKE